MIGAHFTRHFSAAHRVANDPGACQRVHGHNYEVEITIQVDYEDLDVSNFVIPFDHVKGIIDRFDHRLILDDADPMFKDLPDGWVVRVPGVPSTEFLANLIATQLAARLKDAVVKVTLREGPGIQALAIVNSR